MVWRASRIEDTKGKPIREWVALAGPEGKCITAQKLPPDLRGCGAWRESYQEKIEKEMCSEEQGQL